MIIQKRTAGALLKQCLLLMFMVSLMSCAKKISFITSSIIPAAEGKVKVKRDRNNNNAIEVNVTNLAEPEKLSPSRETYVVWMETDRNGLKNIGQLNASSGLFSSTLKASLNTVTTFRPIRFFITAEDDGNIQYPGSMVVLSTDHFNYRK